MDLTAAERLAIAHDVLEPEQDYSDMALSLLPPLAATSNRYTLFMLDAALDHLMKRVTDVDRAALDAWIVKALGGRAHAVGIVPRDKDDLLALETRWDLVSLVGRAGDPQILAEARKLSPADL